LVNAMRVPFSAKPSVEPACAIEILRVSKMPLKKSADSQPRI
jgi:hypothetical protein